MDAYSYERQEETLAMLKLLALGKREIALGHFRDADDVFADLDRLERPIPDLPGVALGTPSTD